jgi:hypothetical protein
MKTKRFSTISSCPENSVRTLGPQGFFYLLFLGAQMFITGVNYRVTHGWLRY